MKDLHIKKLLIPFAIVICNSIIGHYFTPTGILLTPIIIVTTTLLVIFNFNNNKVFLQSACIYFFIALNDILIKLFSGGSHDSEGYGWIHGALFLGLIPALSIYAIKLWQNKEETTQNKLLAMGLLVLLLVAHLSEFDDLGLGRYY
jgi:hypothetical protein